MPLVAITAFATLLFGLRLVSPSNFLDQDQERPGCYVLDAIRNGNWTCQCDITGDISSKPPFYTWLCAIISLVAGRATVFAMWLPGALSAWGVACLIFQNGKKYFGERAAFMAAIASMLTTAGLKEFGLARTDGVFTFTITAAAFLAFRAWTRGSGWTWFWIMAAIATLTKGPLGVVLAAGGLLAAWWERKAPDRIPLRGSHLLGIAAWLLIAAGWFALAYAVYGHALAAKMIGRELLGKAVADGPHRIPGTLFWQPPLYYLGRAAPWSIFGCIGFWRVWRHPAADPAERRFERFLFCWFFPGLVIFSLASHQRADLLWPIFPAAALLAGRELALLCDYIGSRKFAYVYAFLIAAIFGGFVAYYFGPHARMALTRQTAEVKTLAANLERAVGPEFPLTHVDDPRGLQFYLNSWRPKVSVERAAQLLRGAEPAFVALTDISKFEAARKPDDPPFFTLLPLSGQLRKNTTRIISNVPRLEKPDRYAFCFGPIHVRASNAGLVEATERGFSFTRLQKDSEITVTNESPEPRKIRLSSSRGAKEHLLGPGEILRLIGSW